MSFHVKTICITKNLLKIWYLHETIFNNFLFNEISYRAIKINIYNFFIKNCFEIFFILKIYKLKIEESHVLLTIISKSIRSRIHVSCLMTRTWGINLNYAYSKKLTVHFCHWELIFLLKYILQFDTPTKLKY